MKIASILGRLAAGVLLLMLAGCGGKAPGAAASSRPAQPPAGVSAGRSGEGTASAAARPAPEPANQSTPEQATPPVQPPAAGQASPPRPTPYRGSRSGTMGGRGMMGGGMMGGMMGQPADTAAAPTASVIAATAPGCPTVSPELVNLGREVFAGAGNCYACHGSNARGSVTAPDLTDGTWLDIDGSYAAIAGLVRAGVPHPEKYPTPMPPMGGAHLSVRQICAVAAYVHGLGD